jgi:hypothetical protein
MKKYIDFNINHNIKIKLTKEGEKILAQHHEKTKVPDWYYTNYIDINGWWSFQLHNVCIIFGKYLYNGNNNLPFETNIKIEIEE